MISPSDPFSKGAFDTTGIGALRQTAKSNDPAALKTVATQFEAMFINMMMKSMRDATPKDGVMDSEQSRMFTTMLDQQTSQSLAKRGTGLADMLIRQLTPPAGAATGVTGMAGNGLSGPFSGPALAPLSSNRPAAAGVPVTAATGTAAATATTAATTAAAAVPAARVSGRTRAPHVRAFQEKLGADAEAASRATGVPAKFMLGQAALESGWGKHEIRGRDGVASRNLFGIKAGPDWKGKVAEAATTEYVNGVPHTRVEKFRAYDSYADSFQDYAKLLVNNKRYEKVLASAGDASSFARGLQRAGYATDPHYATKLTRIIQHSLVG
jgi:flagellar protein FlgJ